MADQSNLRVIAIGASAGGFNAVVACLREFKERADLAFLVVLHGYTETHVSVAARMDKLIHMPVVYVENNMELIGGKLFLARPDRHLVVSGGRLFIIQGPKENLFRPSIDVLFRSVAVELGNKAIGVLLTGRLTDGTLGLGAIKKCGGIIIVQDPETAEFPDMPLYAQRSLDPDYILSLEDMPAVFEQLLSEPLPPAKNVPETLRRQVEITSHVGGLDDGKNKNENIDNLSCPSCGGPLTAMEEEVVHFRCKIGHAFTMQSLNEEQERQLEETLWVAMRVLEERSTLLKRMIYDYQKKGFDRLAKSNQEKLAEVEKYSLNLKKLIGIGSVNDPHLTD